MFFCVKKVDLLMSTGDFAYQALIAEDRISDVKARIFDRIEFLVGLIAVSNEMLHPEILAEIEKFSDKLDILSGIYEKNCIYTECIGLGNVDIENTPPLNASSVDPIDMFCTDEVRD